MERASDRRSRSGPTPGQDPLGEQGGSSAPNPSGDASCRSPGSGTEPERLGGFTLADRKIDLLGLHPTSAFQPESSTFAGAAGRLLDRCIGVESPLRLLGNMGRGDSIRSGEARARKRDRRRLHPVRNPCAGTFDAAFGLRAARSRAGEASGGRSASRRHDLGARRTRAAQSVGDSHAPQSPLASGEKSPQAFQS